MRDLYIRSNVPTMTQRERRRYDRQCFAVLVIGFVAAMYLSLQGVFAFENGRTSPEWKRTPVSTGCPVTISRAERANNTR